MSKGKDKIHPITGHEGSEGSRYIRSYTLPLNSVLDGVGGQCHGPAAFLRERPGTQCIGGSVGPRFGLEGCGKLSPHQDSIPGPSSPQ